MMNNETKLDITLTVLEVKYESLKPYIYNYWLFISSEKPNLCAAITAPPLGFPMLQFVFGNCESYYQIRNKNTTSIITGIYSKHATLTPAPKMGLVTINFKPYGFYNFFGKTPPNGTQDSIDGYDIFKKENLNSAIENISITETNDELVNCLEDFLCKNQKVNVKKNDYFDSLVDKIFAKKGLIDIDKLINEKFSIRTFQRYFSKVLGVSPKTFSRILRHKYIIQLMYTKPNISWNDLCFQGFYFDQSHFIKDFKDFTKCKPTEYDYLKTSIIYELFK
ncbi:MAG: AraC family transcriptional regulator [Bacteroidales bacterium]|nr:AraC family transcriptional regulator [Bacteroidales bacterium]HNY43508.1 helix-turn-helix domain-containing protein [Bacteroidales bacterium]